MTTTFHADSVPAPVSPGLFSDSAPPISGGSLTALTAQMGQAAALANLGIRFGGGSVAVAQGLELSATGLNVTVATGAALMGSVVRVLVPQSATLNDDSDNRVWLTPGGTIVVRTDTVMPSGGAVFLGTVRVASGAASVDDAGVMRLRGGVAVRRTSDIGLPGDTPSADVSFLTITRAGSYWWNGQYYDARLAALATINLPDSDYTLAENFWANRSWSFRGTLSAARTINLPAINSGERWVINLTNQNLTLGSVTLIPGQSAWIHFDGTTWL